MFTDGESLLTLPDATDTLVGKSTTDVLNNKSLVNGSCAYVDGADNTKQLIFSTSSSTSGTSCTLRTQQSVNAIIWLPVISDTLVGRSSTDTLTNKNITGTTNTVRATQLGTTGSDVVVNGASAPSTGQVLTATGTSTASWQSLPFTFADSTFAITEATGKSLQFYLGLQANNTITAIYTNYSANSTLQLPNSASDTIVARATSDTLTNKNITGTTNTVRATQLGTAGSDIVVSGASAPSNGQVLTCNGSGTANWQTPAALVTTFADSAFAITEATGKQLQFYLGQQTNNTITAIYTNYTANSTIQLPHVANDWIVSRTSTDTLTNKTITDPSNAVRATILGTSGSDVAITSSAPTGGQVLMANNSTTATW